MKNIILSIIIIAIVIIGGYYLFSSNNNPAQNLPDVVALATTTGTTAAPVATTTPTILPNDSHMITINTNYGTIVFETYDSDAPNTVANFIKLTDKGFYNGLTFHRVIPGF